MGERCDVAVVGAGPAGCMAALGLATAGGRVILVERDEPPRYKTCGGGVVGRARAMLPDGLQIPWQQECRQVRLSIRPEGLDFVVERADPIVSMVMRSELDQALTGAAVDAGAELWAPCSARDLLHRGRSVELVTSEGTIEADFVVAADGALSVTARTAGWPALMVVPALEWEIRVPQEIRQRFTAARFDVGWTPEGYAWVFPKREHLSVGILSMRRGAARLKRQLEAYLVDAGIHAIDGAERHGYVVPIRPRASGLAMGRVLVAGDTAGLADPITGEGISHALLSGKLAAEAILEGRADPWYVQHIYEERAGTQILAELSLARALAWCLYRTGRFRSWLMRSFGDDFCQAVAAVYSGKRTYRNLLLRPRTYGQAVKRRWGRRAAG